MRYIIIFLIFAFTLASFKTNEEQKFKFEFTQQQLQLIFSAVDNSSLPHDKVKEIENLIQQQYTAQLPKTDSTIKKK